MKKLSRNEMKNLKGGEEGIGCMEEYTYDCHLVRTPYPCCEGLSCERNATNSGSICVEA